MKEIYLLNNLKSFIGKRKDLKFKNRLMKVTVERFVE